MPKLPLFTSILSAKSRLQLEKNQLQVNKTYVKLSNMIAIITCKEKKSNLKEDGINLQLIKIISLWENVWVVFGKTFYILNNYLRSKESFLEYYEIIKYGWGDQIQLSLMGSMIYLITPDRMWSPHTIQKWFLITYI